MSSVQFAARFVDTLFQNLSTYCQGCLAIVWQLMALILAPIGAATAGSIYLYVAYQLSKAVDSGTRGQLLGTTEHQQHHSRHHGLFAASTIAAYAVAARGLRPAFGKLKAPEGVENVVEFVQTVAPGLARHAIAGLTGVAAGSGLTAAFDVQTAQPAGKRSNKQV